MARILVVDDEPDVRELFNITLKMAGHVTETAKDGVEAVERLNTEVPDLIVLDLMMPRLDGFGLLTHIREKMESEPMRVLVATAKVLEEADNSKLGAWPVVGVLNKGELDISAMVNVVSSALSKEPLKHRPAQETGDGQKQPQPPPQPAAPPPSEPQPTQSAVPAAPQPAAPPRGPVASPATPKPEEKSPVETAKLVNPEPPLSGSVSKPPEASPNTEARDVEDKQEEIRK